MAGLRNGIDLKLTELSPFARELAAASGARAEIHRGIAYGNPPRWKECAQPRGGVLNNLLMTTSIFLSSQALLLSTLPEIPNSDGCGYFLATSFRHFTD